MLNFKFDVAILFFVQKNDLIEANIDTIALSRLVPATPAIFKYSAANRSTKARSTLRP